MILIIDNYDSFVFNLAHLLRELGQQVEVRRNDGICLAEVTSQRFEAVVLSPGPGRPEQAGICVPLLQAPHLDLPVWGVCLGHQAIATAFGGGLVRSRPVHGRTTRIEHDRAGLFRSLATPFAAGRYHSLTVAEPVPPPLCVTARGEGLVMGLAHHDRPIVGVQFHPESILTSIGPQLAANFLQLVRHHRQSPLRALSEVS